MRQDMGHIKAEMKVAEVLRRWPGTYTVFRARGCPDMRSGFFRMMSRFMSIKNAARMHRIPLDAFLDDLKREALRQESSVET